jgi:hypothetical protein
MLFHVLFNSFLSCSALQGSSDSDDDPEGGGNDGKGTHTSKGGGKGCNLSLTPSRIG